MASWLCNATLSNVVSNALCTISCSNDSQTALPRREGKQNISEQVVVKRFSSRVGWLPSYLPPFIFCFFSNNSWLVVSSYQSSSKVSSCCSKFRFHPHHLSIFCVFPCRWHRTEWGGLRWSHCTMGCESGLDDAVEAGMRWLRLGDTLIWSRVVIPESEKEQPSRFGSRSLDYCCDEYHSNPGHGLGCQTWFPGECPLELEMTQYQRITY